MKTRAVLGLGATALAIAGGGLGAALYLSGAFRQREPYDLAHIPRPDDPRFPLALSGLSNSPAVIGRYTGFWVEADAIWRARLDGIARARRTIHFETYAMSPGRRAEAFAAALVARANAGVEVHLLADAHGARRMPASYWHRLRDAGVVVRHFRQMSWHAPMDWFARTHRKLLLIDGEQAYIGGAGVADEWDGRADLGDERPWRDLELRFEGPVVGVLEGMYLQNWIASGGRLDLKAERLPTFPRGVLTAACAPIGVASERERHPEARTVLITSGSYSLENSMPAMLYHVCIEAARHRLWLASPYFTPDETTTQRLIEAARKGVDVRVLTMGPHNNRPFVRWASQALYGRLLRGRVSIYEYQPSMMHAKLLLVDDDWVSTGSANFDHLSFYNNDELNISCSAPGLVEDATRFFTDSFAEAEPLSYATWRARPRLERAHRTALASLQRFF